MEIGRLFRTPPFNSYARLAQGPRARDTLSMSELHALLHDPKSDLLTPKLLASLSEPADPRPDPVFDAPSTLIGMRLRPNGLPRDTEEVRPPQVAYAGYL